MRRPKLMLALTLELVLTSCSPLSPPQPESKDVAYAADDRDLVPKKSASIAEVPDEEPAEEPAEAVDPRRAWCEPVDRQLCRDHRDCPDNSRCVTPWWSDDEVKVCARKFPSADERRWRADRLRVYVDHVCRRGRGCDPNKLHKYLRLLAVRESSLRPWKRARLNRDLEANASAWARNHELFAGNAARDPDRWSTGLGYYSQIPAIWLVRWDVQAPPEVLCGEVEASEVHLRGARDAVRKIAHGVDCGGKRYTGSAPGGGPSWYDASLANMGRLCPGDARHKSAFEARAAARSLDPWEHIEPDDLGAEIGRPIQDQVAAALRVEMDLI